MTSQKNSIHRTHTISCILLAAAVAAFSACASRQAYSNQAGSSLPLETSSSSSGKVASIQAYERADRLYVAGMATQHPLSGRAHVDIQLIGTNGAVIAEKRDEIYSPHSASGGGKRYRDSYIASFPLAMAHRAQKVRVIYHGGSTCPAALQG